MGSRHRPGVEIDRPATEQPVLDPMLSEQLVDPRQRRELLGFGHMVIFAGRCSEARVRPCATPPAHGVPEHHGPRTDHVRVAGGWLLPHSALEVRSSGLSGEHRDLRL